jgi:integrase
MHISELIDDITDITNQGMLVIKPMSKFKSTLSDIEDTKLWETKTVHKKSSGKVTFGLSKWGSPREHQNPIHLLQGSSEIAFQTKAFSLLKYVTGDVEGGTGYKSLTVNSQSSPIRKLGEHLIDNGYTSFHQLNGIPELKLRNLAHEFFFNGPYKKDEAIPENELRLYEYGNWNYSLLSDITCHIFQEVALDFCGLFPVKVSTSNSHPIIPTRILKLLIQWSESVVNKSKENIESFEELNLRYIDCLTGRTSRQKEKGDNKLRVSKIVHQRLANNETLQNEMKESLEYFKDLQRATLLLTLAFTGMRIEEALAIKAGAASEVDGEYIVISTMTKTDETEVDLPWVTNKSVYEAINLLTRLEKCFSNRSIALLAEESKSLSKGSVHNLQTGIERKSLFHFSVNYGANYVESTKISGFSPDKHGNMFPLYEIYVTEEDIEQLENAESNIKAMRGKDKGKPYQTGDMFRLSAHMFRHTFAWFIMANRLGTLDDIRYQYNHLSAAMTMVYTQRGIASADELIEIYAAHEARMVNEVATEILEQGRNGTLGGGGGERFNKIAKDLVIGITDAGSDDSSYVRQIHFEDFNELNDFLEKNLKHVRGLPHGYCTGAEECKIKNAGVPSGCVYCGSYTVAERHIPHWVAKQKYTSEKLALYAEYSEDNRKKYELLAVTWRNTLNAANIVISNYENSPNDMKEEAV